MSGGWLDTLLSWLPDRLINGAITARRAYNMLLAHPALLAHEFPAGRPSG